MTVTASRKDEPAAGATTVRRLSRPWRRVEVLDRSLEDEVLSRARALPAGAEIALEGERSEPILLVLDGWVASWKMLGDGRRQIIDIALPMDVLTPLSPCGETAWCGVETLTPAVVSTPSSEAVNARGAMPGGGGVLGAMASAARARQAERILRIGQGSAYERVAYALLELYVRLEAIGRVTGRSFRLPVTQQRVGEYTGLSSVHVCRTLNRLAADAVIEHHGQKIEVKSLDTLAEIADVHLDRFRATILPGRP